MPQSKQSPYVGEYAFSHKGGVHASGVEKNPSTYEHINPELVGNSRNVIVSDQSGKSNLLNRLKKMSIDINENQIKNILRILNRKNPKVSLMILL